NEWNQQPPKTPFREFIRWCHQQDETGQELFWKDYLKGFDSHTEIPLEKRTADRVTEPGRSTVTLEETINSKIDTFTRKHKITPASVFYGAWGMLYQRYCNNEDIVFGTTVSGRSAGVNGIEDMVGLFINTIPLRVRTGGSETIADFLYRINESLTEREQYETTPLVDIKSYSELGNEGELFNSIVV
ncbi:MAG: hypothetical protein GY940_16485, partial [bacterium]|nr:hypothetical protein [bacterium]